MKVDFQSFHKRKYHKKSLTTRFISGGYGIGALVIFISCLLFSCKSKSVIKLRPGKIKGTMVEGKFIDDSVMDGEIKYYNDMSDYKKGKVSFIEHYKYGVKNGPSTVYFSNGKIWDSSNFTDGYEEGYHYVYNFSGTLHYIDYYHKGRIFGPQIYFNENDSLDYYCYYSFERGLLFNASYKNGKLAKQNGYLQNFLTYQLYLNENINDGLFAYLIQPPKMNVKYELVARKENHEISIRKFNQEVFFDTIFYPKRQYQKYYMKITTNESSNGRGKIYYSELAYGNHE